MKKEASVTERHGAFYLICGRYMHCCLCGHDDDDATRHAPIMPIAQPHIDLLPSGAPEACGGPAEVDPELSADLLRVVSLVDDVLHERRPMTEALWRQLIEETSSLARADACDLNAAVHEVVLRKPCRVGRWRAVDPDTFYRKLLDNGRWVRCLSRLLNEESDEDDEVAPKHFGPDDGPCIEELSTFRRAENQQNERLFTVHETNLRARFPSVQWDDVPSTPCSVWRDLRPAVDLEDDGLRRAFEHATRNVAFFRDAHRRGLLERFAHRRGATDAAPGHRRV
jgi:hypothetical protein